MTWLLGVSHQIAVRTVSSSISHARIALHAGPNAFLSVAYFHTPGYLEALYTSRAMLDVWDSKRRTTQFLSKEIGLHVP